MNQITLTQDDGTGQTFMSWPAKVIAALLLASLAINVYLLKLEYDSNQAVAQVLTEDAPTLTAVLPYPGDGWYWVSYSYGDTQDTLKSEALLDPGCTLMDIETWYKCQIGVCKIDRGEAFKYCMLTAGERFETEEECKKAQESK